METSHFPTTDEADDEGPWEVDTGECCFDCGKPLVIVRPVGSRLPTYWCSACDPHRLPDPDRIVA